MAVRSEINIREAISALGYVLQDDSPITVYVTSFLSTDQDTKVTHAFTFAVNRAAVQAAVECQSNLKCKSTRMVETPVTL